MGKYTTLFALVFSFIMIWDPTGLIPNPPWPNLGQFQRKKWGAKSHLMPHHQLPTLIRHVIQLRQSRHQDLQATYKIYQEKSKKVQ